MEPGVEPAADDTNSQCFPFHKRPPIIGFIVLILDEGVKKPPNMVIIFFSMIIMLGNMGMDKRPRRFSPSETPLRLCSYIFIPFIPPDQPGGICIRSTFREKVRGKPLF
ncbi:MAG: hypothetical protein A2V45_07220 [Candidatus Aminicenantes bacterium RBG_19FT_COMBO_58_17]|nr:MAG: hypothetical protein A2V45_07220 [Candidatus Aminicenantes bacterium RBG_19FT_COMBO_58_17]